MWSIHLLRIFERKILRKIYGSIQEGDIWRIRNNEELNKSINGEDITKFIKAQRIRWLGNVNRMEVGAMQRKMMEGRPFIGRRKGRPRLRWLRHVNRMEVGAMQRKMMEGRPFIGRRKGRLRLRWMDDVVADLKVMKIKQWMEKTKDREQWRLVVEEAKAHPGL